jgi:hypothetical protein
MHENQIYLIDCVMMNIFIFLEYEAGSRTGGRTALQSASMHFAPWG